MDPEIAKGVSICVVSRNDFERSLIFIDYVIIRDVTADIRTYVNTKNSNQSSLVAQQKQELYFSTVY